MIKYKVRTQYHHEWRTRDRAHDKTGSIHRNNDDNAVDNKFNNSKKKKKKMKNIKKK